MRSGLGRSSGVAVGSGRGVDGAGVLEASFPLSPALAIAVGTKAVRVGVGTASANCVAGGVGSATFGLLCAPSEQAAMSITAIAAQPTTLKHVPVLISLLAKSATHQRSTSTRVKGMGSWMYTRWEQVMPVSLIWPRTAPGQTLRVGNSILTFVPLGERDIRTG